MLTPTRTRPNIRVGEAHVSQAQRLAEQGQHEELHGKLWKLSQEGTRAVVIKMKASGQKLAVGWQVALETIEAGRAEIALVDTQL